MSFVYANIIDNNPVFHFSYNYGVLLVKKQLINILSVIFALALFLNTLTFKADAPVTPPIIIGGPKSGDVNCDGSVTGEDAALIADYLAKSSTVSSAGLKVADVNGDGEVNIGDAVIISRFLCGDIEKLPISYYE